MDFGIGSFSTDIDVHGGLEEVGEVGRATGRRSSNRRRCSRGRSRNRKRSSNTVVVVVVVVVELSIREQSLQYQQYFCLDTQSCRFRLLMLQRLLWTTRTWHLSMRHAGTVRGHGT